MPQSRASFSLRPLPLAIAAVLLQQPASADLVNWAVDADGFWDVTSNWSSSPVLPGAADDVTLDVGGATVRTITHRTGTTTLNSLTSEENLALTGGTLTLNGASSVNATFTQSAGTLSGAGTLTLNGPTTLSGGTMAGSGTTRLLGTSTLTSVNLDAGRILRNEGTATWSGTGTLDLNATSTGGSGRIDNAAGATFEATGNGTLRALNFGDVNSLAGFPAFNNAGTFRKTGGTGTTTIDVALNNTGTVEVASGTLVLSAGGSHTGAFVFDTGNLSLSGGTHNFQAGSSLSGTNLTLGGANITLAGSYDVSGTTTVTSGTHSLTSATVVDIGDNLVISSGSLDLGGLDATVNLAQTGGTLIGTGTLTVNGPTTLSGGTMAGSGTTRLLGASTLTGFGLDAGRILRNEGTATWTGTGTLELNATSTGGSGRIDNAAGATFEATGNGTMRALNFGDVNSLAGFPAFNNAGTFRKTGGTGTTTLDVALNNTGTVEVASGTLVLSGGGTHTGAFLFDTGNLSLSGGTHDFQAGSSLSGTNLTLGGANLTLAGSYDVSGTTTVTSGTHSLTSATVVDIGDNLTISGGSLDLGGLDATVNLAQTGGTLIGTGTLTLNGPTTLSGGTMSGSGTTRLLGASTLTSLSLDAGRILRNEGTATWTTSATLELNATSGGGAGRIDNIAGATFEATGNGTLRALNFGDVNSLAGFPAFNNAGTFRKTGGTGTTTIDVALNNTGTVEVASGTLVLSGGGTHTGAFVFDTGNLSLSGGSHDFQAGSSLTGTNLTLGGANITLAGSYDVSGTTTVTSGTHSLVGATVVDIGDNLTISGGSLDLGGLDATVNLAQTGGTLIGTGTLTVNGPTTLSGGTMAGSGTTRLLGASTLTGFGLDAGRILRNEGTATWTGTGTLELNATSTGGAGRIDNAAGATFEATGNGTVRALNFGDVNSLAGFPAFNNAGTLRKTTGVGTTNIDVAFNNTGTVEVASGTLNLSAGGSQSGTLSLAAGTTLQFSGGTHALTNINLLPGTGRLLVSSGNVDLVGDITHGGLLQVTGGTVTSVDDIATVDFTQSGGTMSGAGDLTISGIATLTSGTMAGAGTTRLLGTSTLSGTGLDAGRVLRNEGTMTWTGNGTVETNATGTGGSGRIDNAAGAIFEATGNGTVRALTFGDVNSLAGFPAFNNAGTVRKTGGTGTTSIQTVFNNTGTVEVASGTLDLSGGGSQTGTLDLAAGTTLQFSGGTHALTNINLLPGTGRLLVSNGNVDLTGAINHGGLLQVTGGILSSVDDIATVDFTQSGGTVSGAGDLIVSGIATLSGGTMTGAGLTRLLGTSTLSATSLDAGRVLRNEGTTTWTGNGTLETNATAAGGAGRIDNAVGATFEATGNGTLRALTFVDLNSVAGFPAFNNAGVFRKTTGTGSTSIQIAFNNSGTVEVSSGTLDLSDVVTQHSGTTLTGGTWRVSGTGALSFSRSGAQNIVTNQGDVTLDGATASFARINTLTDNQGAFRLLGARNFTAVGAFDNSGVLQLGGGSFGAPTLTNQASGEIFGFGSVTPTVLNHGLVRAVGGILTLAGGIDGQSGTIQVDEGATLALGANSDGDFLVNNGTLALGTSNVTVEQDYTNAAFGAGNGFNARANVTGSGQILAAGDVAQALSGDVTNGAGAAPQMAFGNIHVGDQVTRSFAVSNTGANGPALRGALQTSVNGGNLTDARLSGSGVTAGNYAPVAAGASSTSFDVTFSGASAGALSGQAVAVVNNFDNVAEQVLSISGAVFRYANPTAHSPAPVVFGNRRVGDSATQLLSLTNDVPNDGFSESLDASIGGATGNATTNGGSFSLLAAGATNSTALEVGIDTSSAGAKSGTATITLTSNGAGTSELGTTALGTQTVNVSGDVYRLASAGTHSPSPVVFANRHVGAAATQALSLTNTAANDGFSERLNATIGGATGNVSTNGGSFSLLGAGQTDASSLTVSLDTSTAGAKSGTATIALASDGTGTSGFGALELDAQTVNVSGNVYRFAEASAHSPAPVVFANRHVGSAASQTLTLTNLAAADGFSESLDASIGGATGNATTNGGSFSLLAAGASNGAALQVGIDTSSAGAKSGTATITLTSNGAGTSDLGTTALGTQTVNVSGDVYRFAEAGTLAAAPIVFANRHVGESALQALTLTNNAADDGFSERLDAAFSGVTGNAVQQGSVSLLGAGQSSNGLVVGIDTSTAGAKSGTVTVGFTSNGAGTSDLGTTVLDSQVVTVQGNVYRFAQAGTVAAVEFGNVHVGDVVSRTLSLSNIAAADGFSESLDATFAGVSDARILTSGSVSGLVAGATDSSSLVVGLDTSTAGSLTGFATLNFTSNGVGTSGLGTTALGTQNVGVTTNVAVYRFADGAVDTAQPIDLGAFRVGDTAGTQGVTVRNAAVNDGFSENLDVSVASVDAGFTASGTVTGLSAGSSDSTTMRVGLDTSTSGVKSGEATLAYVSNGEGTSDLGLTAVGSESVTLGGRVYAQAVASVETVGIDFGIVHVGDVIGARSVTVRNIAAGTLTDNLLGSISAVPAGFVGNGSLGVTGLAQGEASSALSVGLSTNAAGVFSGAATLSFASHNAEMADLLLGNQAVTLSGQVNNYANAVLDKAGGEGTFAQVNVGQFVFDFGTLTAGGSVAGLLSLANVSPGGPTDVLGADFDIGGGAFTLTGFDAFSGLATTDSSRMLEVSLNPMVAGLFEQVVRINLYGENASGFRGALGTYELTLRANVAPIPVPGAVWLLGSALVGLARLRRRV